jgi:hydroxymethylbilane synthase
VHSCIKHLPSHELKQTIKIGTRESQLAVWQATLVQELLQLTGVESQIIFIKSEGDLDTVTPLYELGVQGIFTKSLDSALLNNRIDIAVHSLKDVPTKLADGTTLAAVLKRGSYKDIYVYKDEWSAVSKELSAMAKQPPAVATAEIEPAALNGRVSDSKLPLSPIRHETPYVVATSSIRRMAQWLHRYPHHRIENLRGNVNTRLRKLSEHNWNGAIFAAAGLERIGLRPQNSIDLDWMLPAPAQGAITIACRQEDTFSFGACRLLNDLDTEQCTKIERDFLRGLLGGCSTPISALAVIENDAVIFKGNICSPDGTKKIEIEKTVSVKNSEGLGTAMAHELLKKSEDAHQIIHGIKNAKK